MRHRSASTALVDRGKPVALLLLVAFLFSLLSAVVLAQPASATGQEKVAVCKFVGTPGVDERLQTGDNPIEVSVNAIEHNEWDGSVPGWFSDKHDRSYVLGYVTEESSYSASDCPTPVPPDPQEEPLLPDLPEISVTPATCENPENMMGFTGLVDDMRLIAPDGTRVRAEDIPLGTFSYEQALEAFGLSPSYGVISLQVVVYDRDDKWPSKRDANGDVVLGNVGFLVVDPSTLDCQDPEPEPVVPASSSADVAGQQCLAHVVVGGSSEFTLTAPSDRDITVTLRFKSLGDGTGGVAETYYKADGTTGAPGEIIDFVTVTIKAGESYSTSIAGLPAGDYRWTVNDGGFTNEERRALIQDVTVESAECLKPQMPEPRSGSAVVETVPNCEAGTTEVTTESWTEFFEQFDEGTWQWVLSSKISALSTLVREATAEECPVVPEDPEEPAVPEDPRVPESPNSPPAPSGNITPTPTPNPTKTPTKLAETGSESGLLAGLASLLVATGGGLMFVRRRHS